MPFLYDIFDVESYPLIINSMSLKDRELQKSYLFLRKIDDLTIFFIVSLWTE